jgi:eukaryotic-like serine/threonine-protein kinase
MADRGDVPALGAEPGADAATGVSDPVLLRAQGRLGSTLRDKWHLDVLLGVGGMAAVYAATHRNGSRAAVKMLHPEMSTIAVVRERFLWEGYVANAVGHDGAVKVIDDDAEEDGSLFLVTELLDGETLEERRVRLGGRIPPDEVLVLTDQLLSVLVAAHGKGIVHRDLKPENVFVTRAGQVKVLDFGIARLRELSHFKGLTQSGTMVGTPAYMAPEHARGLSDEVDERSDLWACGAVMFELLAGRCVHEGRSVNDQLVNAITRAAPSLVSVAPDMGAPVVRVVDRALEFAKNMRWPDAASMRAAVHQAYQELYGRSITTAPKPVLGDGVPDRTLPQGYASGGPNPRVPTTARPVVSSRWPPPLQALSPRGRRMAIAAGGAAAFTLATTFVWLVARERPSPRAQSTSAPMQAASSPLSPPSVSLVVPSGPPEVAATDLPIVSLPPPPRETERERERPSRKPAATPSAAPAPPSVQTNCQPPYTVDSATGKKKWKVECL